MLVAETKSTAYSADIDQVQKTTVDWYVPCSW